QVGSVDDVLRQIDQQKQEVDRKVGVVRKIFSMRKQKLNAITALQTHIPRSTWLQTVEFVGDEIKITGMANSTDDAQSYASLLSQEKDLFTELKNKEISKTEKQEGKPDIFKFEYVGKMKE
ncbi:PilN domain-containing protein, partial [bacterium]|nr:PilN domain-containing protein [bacterium]